MKRLLPDPESATGWDWVVLILSLVTVILLAAAVCNALKPHGYNP